MDAKEYLRGYFPTLYGYLIKNDMPYGIDDIVCDVIESYHLDKSQEEAEERYNEGYEFLQKAVKNRQLKTGGLNTLDYALRIAAFGTGTYDGKRYPVGTRLTSLENGEIIEASPDTPEEEIVCIVKAGKNA